MCCRGGTHNAMLGDEGVPREEKTPATEVDEADGKGVCEIRERKRKKERDTERVRERQYKLTNRTADVSVVAVHLLNSTQPTRDAARQAP